MRALYLLPVIVLVACQPTAPMIWVKKGMTLEQKNADLGYCNLEVVKIHALTAGNPYSGPAEWNVENACMSGKGYHREPSFY